MHLEFSEPVLVSMGPKSREAGWGPYQFPALYKTSDGKLLITFQDYMDLESDYGSELTVYISSDEGKTWERVKEKDYVTEIGLRLPSGDLLHWVEPPAISADDPTVHFKDRSRFIGYKERKEQYFYRWEDVECDSVNKGFIMRRIKAGTKEVVDTEVDVHWPYQPKHIARGVLCRPFPQIRHLRRGPDGTLWMTHHAVGCDPVTGEFRYHAANYVFSSKDDGYSWELAHYLPFDAEKYPDDNVEAKWQEGFDENDIGFAPDGTLFRVIRTCGMYPRTDRCYNGKSYIIHSTDNGKTWSDPEVFDDRGVMPNILTLGCGVSLVGYGRPGLFIRASFDPSARKWEDRIEIIHSPGTPNDEDCCVDVHGTCSYCDLMALDDHTAAFTYSDFTQKDENGDMRKCIMYRTITVVED